MRSHLALGIFLLIGLAQAFTLQHCATPTPPRGGDRDSLGPLLILEESTPNFQTNFRPEQIELTFDEWVEIDLQQQIIISPPIDLRGDNRPELRRRTLVIPLEGVELLDSVTYVVNIGAAIKDLNEGNPTENLRFVFATGPVLDSATVSGSLVDAYSGQPLETATFGLFTNLADTAAFSENPTYFAQTDEEGNFRVYNVKPGNYRAIGLVRAQGATNYYADYSGIFPPVAVGFVDSVITVADGDNRIGSVRVSPVPIPPRIADIDTATYGQIKVTMNQEAELVDYRSGRDYLRRNDKDTLRLFYREAAPDSLYFGRDSIFSDTLLFGGGAAGAGPVRGPSLVSATSGRISPSEGIVLNFDRPLEAVDTTGITLLQDTLPEAQRFSLSLDSVYSAALRITSGWEPRVPYVLTINPGTLTDWYGLTNADTIVRNFNVDNPESFGTLSVKLVNLNPTLNYILRLVDGEDVVVGTRRYVNKRFEYATDYRGMKPRGYRIEVVYDSNENGRYDSGDLRFGSQPEAVRRFEIEPLRANWEVEEVIDLGTQE